MSKILYANGCSHTAAAEAVVPACFAQDDGKHGIDRRPHPTNLAASWCSHVARGIGHALICRAESASSNTRIMRTTREWITNNPEVSRDTLFIIQWTTWEREEWLHRGTYYQLTASGTDWLPDELKQDYKKYIASIDWAVKTQRAHDTIWDFHCELKAKNLNHVFFSGHSTFSDIYNRQDWGHHYIDPYSRESSYHNWLISNGGQYANPKSYHFDAASHRLWANFMLQYLDRNQILGPGYEISFD